MCDKSYILGIDIGKTKVACGIFTKTLKLVDYKTYSSGKCAQEILDIVEKAIKKSIEDCDSTISEIAIASFGIINIDLGCVISSDIISDWNNIQLKVYFESRFHVPVYVENDVKAALYGEYCLLNDIEHNGMLYLSIGTNIGMAYIKDGMLCHGDNGRFGEICQYIPRNEQYSLGQIIGGQGISQQYYSQTGCRKSAEELFVQTMHGDIIARDIYQRMIMSTAALLHWLDVCFDPSYLILGGGVVCYNDSLFKMIKTQYNNLSNKIDKLHLAGLSEKSGIYGVVALSCQKKYGTFPHFF